MKAISIHKTLYLLFGGIFLFMLIGFSLMLVKTYQESKIFTQKRDGLESNLDIARSELKAQEDYLKRFTEDREFFEWVVRQRIGYAEPGEIIFRFDEEYEDLKITKK